jgi:hypothetical protein
MKYKYNIRTGVTKIKTKTAIVATTVTLGFGGATIGIAIPFAAHAQGSDGSNASACGSAHAARADVNGNFGFLGQAGGTPGYHDGAVGQDPGATGYNNSHTSCN